MTLLRDESSCWGRCPQSPRDLSHSRQNDGARRQIARPPLIPAAESALGLRPRSALSSAQVFPEWITATSPCNDLSTNGDNPLNSLSHSRGSVHSEGPTCSMTPGRGLVSGASAWIESPRIPAWFKMHFSCKVFQNCLRRYSLSANLKTNFQSRHSLNLLLS